MRPLLNDVGIIPYCKWRSVSGRQLVANSNTVIVSVCNSPSVLIPAKIVVANAPGIPILNVLTCCHCPYRNKEDANYAKT